MLGWALTFLALAVVALCLGLFGITWLSAGVAKVFLTVFVVSLVASAFSGALREQPPL